MSWIQNHVQDGLQIIGAAVSLATLIVKVTPTSKDDAILSKIITVLSALSLCNADGSFIGKKLK